MEFTGFHWFKDVSGKLSTGLPRIYELQMLQVFQAASFVDALGNLWAYSIPSHPILSHPILWLSLSAVLGFCSVQLQAPRKACAAAPAMMP